MFLLVPAHPGSPGQRAVKRLLLCSLEETGHVFIIDRVGMNVPPVLFQCSNKVWPYRWALGSWEL